MSTPSARMSVLAGKEFACVKIHGRANFNSSIDFKSLLQGLHQKGYSYFVLDLSDCALMDSTFLGVLAGFGLRMNKAGDPAADKRIELLNPNERLTELLENLGVLQLFRVTQGPITIPADCQTVLPGQSDHSREETTRACLEAHQTLIALNPENAAKFKEVTQFLAEDLKKLKDGQG